MNNWFFDQKMTNQVSAAQQRFIDEISRAPGRPEDIAKYAMRGMPKTIKELEANIWARRTKWRTTKMAPNDQERVP